MAEIQTSHIVDLCSLAKQLDGSLSRLRSADDDAVQRLENLQR